LSNLSRIRFQRRAKEPKRPYAFRDEMMRRP
jgi:hypothetical protein